MSEPELGAEGAIGCKTSSAPNPHNLVPGCFFNLHQWRGQLAPYVEDLVSKPGGVLLLAVTVEPKRRNYPDVAFAVSTPPSVSHSAALSNDADAAELRTTLTVMTSQQRKRVKIANKDNVHNCERTPRRSKRGVWGGHKESI